MCDFCDATIGEEEKVIASGDYSELIRFFDINGRLYLIGSGDDYTEWYYPKYCPECGRKLQ